MQECYGAFSTKLADVCGVLCGHAETRAKEHRLSRYGKIWFELHRSCMYVLHSVLMYYVGLYAPTCDKIR